MKFDKYLTESARTVSDQDLDLFTHACMGVATEAIEMYVSIDEKNLKEEIGDVMWYVAMLCRKAENVTPIAEDCKKTVEYALMPSVRKSQQEVSKESFIHAAGEMLNEAKRVKFYKATFRSTEFIKNLLLVVTKLVQVCRFGGWSMEKIMEDNIIKLRKRYPEKFSTENAENRNMEEELRHIE